MRYPEEFKSKVLSTLGYSEEMKKRLDEGQEIVGRFLDDSSQAANIPASDIVEAFENGDMNSIYLRAKKQVMLEELYREWVDLYRCQQYEEDYGEYLDSYSCRKLR